MLAQLAGATTDGVAVQIAPGNVVHSSHVTPDSVATHLLKDLAPQGLTQEMTKLVTESVLTHLQQVSLHVPDPQQQTQHKQQRPHVSLSMDQLQQMHKEQREAAQKRPEAAQQLQTFEDAIHADQLRLDAEMVAIYDEGSTDESEAEWEASKTNAAEKKEATPAR